jgi:hypothetical protein
MLDLHVYLSWEFKAWEFLHVLTNLLKGDTNQELY